MPSRDFWGPPQFGAQEHQILHHFFRDFRTRHRISPEQDVSLTNQNASINLQSKSWPTVCDLWSRNGRDPFRHCDPPFGGHYVATIMSSCYFFIGKSLDWQRIFVNVTRLVHIWRWLALLTGRLYTIRRCQASNCWPVWTVRFTFTACHNVTFEWSWNWTVIKIWPVVGRVGNW